MEIVIKWFENTKYAYNQKLYLGNSHYRKFNAGLLITNIIGACKYIKNIEIGINFEKLHSYILNKEIINEKEKNQDYKYYIIFDLLGFACYGVYDDISSYISKIKESLVDSSQCLTLQKRIDEKMSKINNLYTKYIAGNIYESFNKSIFYEDLIAIMKQYSYDSQLIKKYLEEEGRCFASFITDTNQKYVVLSGFLDNDNKTIADWLGEPIKKDFISKIEEICSKLNAILVKPNLETSMYRFDYCQRITILSSVKDDLDKSSKRRHKYSCCERKLFGYFKNKTPSGILYIKFYMCAECLLGLHYQLLNNNCKIVIKEGLGAK